MTAVNDVVRAVQMSGARVVMIDTPEMVKFEAYETVVTVRRHDGVFVSASVPVLDNIPMDSLREMCPLSNGLEWERQTAFSAIVVYRSNAHGN